MLELMTNRAKQNDEMVIVQAIEHPSPITLRDHEPQVAQHP